MSAKVEIVHQDMMCQPVQVGKAYAWTATVRGFTYLSVGIAKKLTAAGVTIKVEVKYSVYNKRRQPQIGGLVNLRGVNLASVSESDYKALVERYKQDVQDVEDFKATHGSVYDNNPKALEFWEHLSRPLGT